ncbi:MAG: hypothetical protein ACRDQ7_25395 [Haloechinothrix sp.]
MGAIADTTCPQPHGRDAELAELAAVLDDAKRGSSGALLLCGEAGRG